MIISGIVTKVAEDVTDPDRPSRLAYLTVLYPATSHTFIHDEVAGLRDRGIEVDTFSINGIDSSTLRTPFEREAHATTTEIKSMSKLRLARIIASVALAHPLATLGTVVTAARDRGRDLDATLRAIFQVGEALVMYDACRRRSITHIHAHFGQAPTNIAWFTTDFAGRLGETWTFSTTIHGPQDCLAEGDATLVRKVAASSLVVAVSDFTAAQLVRRIEPALWDRVEVIRCGIALSDAPSSTADAPDRPRSTENVLMVARLSPEKGHVVALQALARLKDDGVDARLRLVGPGDPESAVLPAARELGVQDRVDLIGPLSPAEVADEMRHAAVYALPSFAEGLPIVLMEAMNHGCPVVATAISGIPELVDDGVNGRLIPPLRADRLADALAELLHDADERSRLAANARTTVAELHDGRTQVDTLVRSFVDRGILAESATAFAPAMTGRVEP